MTNKMKTIRLFRACYGKEVSHHHLHFKTQSQRNEKIHNGKKKKGRLRVSSDYRLLAEENCRQDN
jgi:hypothetical protein